MTTKTIKKPKSHEVKILFSEFLQREEFRKLVNDVVSQDLLNYFNHHHDIASGLAGAIAGREYAPFSTSNFRSLSKLTGEMYKYFEEECGLTSWRFHGAIRAIFSKYLKENWPSIIKQRMMIEDKFRTPESFIALRQFVIVLKGIGIHFYTKDWDGVGPDIIGNLVTTDLVHSSYEKMSIVQEKYTTAAVKSAFKGFRSFYSFANFNDNIINDSKAGKEFFGPGSYESYFKTLNSRKAQILGSLADLSERLSLPMTMDLNFKARSDSFVFDMVWERKLPEVFYDISKHKMSNRFS